MFAVRTWVPLFAAALIASTPALAQETYLPQCFKPYAATTKTMQFPAKKGPYRIALANGFVGNTWRIQMIKTLKAYADTPEMKPYIKELKIVSTGTDVAAQIGAIDNFINAGFDAILTIAVNPAAFKPVIKRAKDAGVVLIPFDNVLDTEEVIQVNEDQFEMGRMMGRWLEKQGATKGKILEVRGLPGNSVDRDRHVGFREVMDKYKEAQIIEVVGNWDDGTAQKVVADAVAVHGKFAGMFVQGGSTGAVRALIDAKHPFIPVAGEAENGFRKLIAQYSKDGLKGASAGQSPALVAISLKAAVAALQGNKLPQYISVPIPYADYTTLKAGTNYYPDQSDNFFTPNDFPPCGVTFTAVQIMGKSEANQ
jgi:ribose transport system substrate-binding protein